MNSKYSVVSIRSYLSGDSQELGEDVLAQILSEFPCEKNSDVDRFLKESATIRKVIGVAVGGHRRSSNGRSKLIYESE